MDNTIVPDDKDWTWVLETACPECGFEAGELEVTEVGLVLSGPADVLRERRDPGKWSPLEYGAHVRDVYRLYLERLTMMLTADDPLYPNWDQDETAVVDNYGAQNPTVVAEELVVAAEALAAAFDDVQGDQWARSGRRSDGATFTVDTFARYLIHDPVHHLRDVRS